MRSAFDVAGVPDVRGTIPPTTPPGRPGFDPDRPDVRVAPPTVYVEPAWAYRVLTRDLAREASPTEEELDELGKAGWEMVGTFADARVVRFYFKRQTR